MGRGWGRTPEIRNWQHPRRLLIELDAFLVRAVLPEGDSLVLDFEFREFGIWFTLETADVDSPAD